MTPVLQTIRLSQVVFDPAIYPRQEHDPALVRRYADCLEQIEAQGRFMSVSSDLKLLDGKHRWLAYRKVDEVQDREVQVFVYPARTKHEQFAIAVELNSQHGYQLTPADKELCARSMYAMGFTYEAIAAKLSVGKTQVGRWLSETVKDEKDKRNRKIVEMSMACFAQREIAEACGCDQKTVANVFEDSRNSVLEYQNPRNARASYSVEFDAPLYDHWEPAIGESGRIDNLLYAFTKPFDVVVDPFAGSGTTIDLCKRRSRRCHAGDRKPPVEREHEIRRHDILADGIPKPPLWKDVRLVYLDPLSWEPNGRDAGDGPTDFDGMDPETFVESIAKVVYGFAAKLGGGVSSYVALVVQPAIREARDGWEQHDVLGRILRRVVLPVEIRIHAPYEPRVYDEPTVRWARGNRESLDLGRQIVVWRCE